MKEYYAQRACVSGTFLITEGTFISPALGGYECVPGIYNDEQIKAWRDITDAVHAMGSYIFCQLWAPGRTARPHTASREGITVLSASNIPLSENHSIPVPMTFEQIQHTIQAFATAARNAIASGFDGVELHGANGYLIDQFTMDISNKRDDEYGGSIENRSRFCVEVVKAVSEAVGPERTGIRFSPWGTHLDMRATDPISQYSDVLKKIGKFNIAYLSIAEPMARIRGFETLDKLDFAYDLWRGPILVAGGYDSNSAQELVDQTRSDKDIVVLFGRYFISNPDLPFRVREGLGLSPYHRDSFYTLKDVRGYTDYPFSEEFVERKESQA